VAPELIEDRWIGYGDGLETTPGCSADAVMVAVPKDTVLPRKPDCNSSPPAPASDKIKEWFKRLIH
jgi:hypothetical protein